MRPSLPRLLVSIAVFAILVARSAVADDREASFRVIVHPDNPATSVDRAFLRDAYLKKTTEWGNGNTIRPVDLTAKYTARERFAHDVIKKTSAQLKSYWSQQIFSGKGVPPPEAGTPDAVIDYVMANPGAVGYLPAGTDPGRAKIIEVD